VTFHGNRGGRAGNVGISKAAGELLILEAAKRPFRGSVLGLGRQDCLCREEDLTRWARKHGVMLAQARPTSDQPRRYATSEAPTMSDHAFFACLGFDGIHSLDKSAFEGADILHDLNLPLPDSFGERFDLVYNGGTLEHVFHLPNALANVARVLKVGGRVVHIAPASNQIDHGFYSFSPTLLHDYYTQNNWTIRAALIFRARDFESPWTVYRYEPGVLDGLAARFHDVRMSGVTVAGLFFVVEKTPHSGSGVIPQQNAYLRAWEQKPPSQREPRGMARTVRDAKRRFDRHVSIFDLRSMPPKLGVMGR
jgi:SAM-dependent methyltransferase